ncbi:hypothetical protein CH330_01490 [candidate division WOR-3 bacterium JGI_Cruoil_03_51_56]|uniref:Uncharacterized protein n=1 Tax=candidate division WOR-3 bacterium JGI_Cruoil_03_51_56 TaxID=1973747 RepID=A0A235BXA0_UNCW3|nr:MAG: hypothetical protein CH330_01490 [candidate division WOR-3 bacterium JGI_Cruoil_03_51_56]
MSEKPKEEKPEEVAEPELKEFIVYVKAVPAFPNAFTPDILDRVIAANEEEAKDYMVGRLAEHDYIVEKWYAVAETTILGATARALSG